ncbi:deoxyribonuclease-1 isoform X1 [Denticeps clupeoides]|uniref:Endonuclease/exonuclease/phosphatase domain-containing protein n=1 Tax=Denticeps clupeoides TaxID=299321 RepID=A0AAY4D085_9TELE|nr:deoxyribonuclease-1 isoform X1 [Denticeps clupeoides]
MPVWQEETGEPRGNQCQKKGKSMQTPHRLKLTTLEACHTAVRPGTWHRQLMQYWYNKRVVLGKQCMVVHRYDIILIQEVRDSDLTATQKLMQHVNKAPSPHVYDYIVSEQLGSNSYKERYLFLYRTESVSVIKSFTYDDGCESCGTDTFSREPFVVMFSSRLSAVKNFALVPQHTSPELAVKEVNALYDVAAYTRDLWKTNDIILLGDFNAGCDYILDSEWQQIRLFTDKSYHWLITDDADTTVTHTKCPYDRIVATADMMSGIAPNSAKVFEFESALGLSQEMALAVSDHFPVEVKLL